MTAGIHSHTVTTVLLAASLLAGCSESPAGPEVPLRPELAHVPALAAGRDGLVPFRLDASAVLLAQDFAPDFGPPLFGKSDFDGRCSTPSDFLIRFGLVGEATHLGALTGTAEHCSQVDFQTGASSVTDGVMTLTAANGDELHATYMGQPGPRGLEEHLTFVGGSGRFESATGNAISRPTCDRSAGTCVLVSSGGIAYDAADSAER